MAFDAPRKNVPMVLTRLVLLFVLLLTLAPARADTLAQVKARGYVSCGVTDAAPGFSSRGEDGVWRGFDVDYCRALAAAIFDDADKVKFSGFAARDRAGALLSGAVDVLAGGAGWTLSRDAGQKLHYAAVSFFDGQGFLAPRKLAITAAQDLAGKAICVQQGGAQELALADFFRARKAEYAERPFASFEEAAKAYDAQRCDVLTGDVSQLSAARATLAAPAEHIVLTDLVAKSLHGPMVRHGDDAWFDVVRWTLFALLDAEELGLSSQTVDAMLTTSDNPDIRRLLGVEGDHGDGLGLPADWAYRVVKHVGNYAEVFERNLGQGSPLAMERRLNALWSRGGVMVGAGVR